ncbi:MAG: diaminopimelate decarboxylase [Spirochaetaceae bacterium]|nr:MAG: diaminopimelate decarboxylase [Spirochaetaceae bacterium]
MADKTVPFSRDFIAEVSKRYPTPFHIYDEAGIRATCREFATGFPWVPGGFRNYYAVKALPNPAIMRIVADEGMGFDCSSMAELILAEHLGTPGDRIMFTSNDTPIDEFAKAKELGAIINLDDYTHIDYLHDGIGMPERICLRYNPGSLKEGNVIIGKPEEAKYGFTREQIIAGYARAAELGVKEFGLHTMVASNELNPDYFVETAQLLFELAVEVRRETGVRISFLNLGGGIGIPYRPEQTAVDIAYVARGIRALYDSIVKPAGLDPMQIAMENGRCVTGPHGYLVGTVRHVKKTYKQYVGLDATMANLMRPGMYGAYHHITVLGKENAAPTETYDVTGSLCENNDKFSIDRPLPPVESGDLVVIHDTGAHGHSMGFNYNGKLRSAELLLKEDRSVELIRRAETYADYFATLPQMPKH